MLGGLKEMVDLMLVVMLNPVTWLIVVLLAIWCKPFWSLIVSGAITQLLCFLILAYYLEFFEEPPADFGWLEILATIMIVTAGGIIISLLVGILFRRRRLSLLTP
jgi:hypothetical protein